MITRTNKIILLVFFSILGIGTLFIFIQFLSLRRAEWLGYKETPFDKNLISNLINDKYLSKMEIDYSYVNNANNKLYILDYDKEYKLIICKLNEYRGIKNSSIILNKSIKIKQDDKISYGMISTQEQPYMVIQSKTKLPETQMLYFKVDKSTNITREGHNKNLDAYEFRMNQIGFSSELNKNDFIISSFIPTYVSFIISTRNDDFLCYMLYSLNGNRVKTETLLEIIKKKK